MGVKTSSAVRRIRGGETSRPHRFNLQDRANQKGAGRSAFLFAISLFCSGTAALIYQVLWIKQLSLIVGVEIYSIALAVSAFFAGLALGSSALGRLADRVEKPFLLYAALESGIALFGVGATLLLSHAAEPFAEMETHVGALAWVLPFLLVGIPALLMGGTLPVAIRSWSVEGESIARGGGSIYAVNTAGGIAGALLCSFAFLPWFGVRGTAFAADALNLPSALIAFSLNRRSPRKERHFVLLNRRASPTRHT